MATQQAVWGIDIGQCALKAMRVALNPDAKEGEVKFVADAFDHIEYTKILSQPEADPVALVREALEQFLSRNQVREDRVAISVPGQAGLARFIKLPPVESKKIPDIVKFEAKQQIPFDLADVIWDYQRMAGGTEEEGFSLETEVGLFAMKRDQVFAALEPFSNAGIDVDYVQLAPLAIYNFVVADQFGGLPDIDEYDPDDPPESLIVMAMGTDTTDLVITNGFRVWQRSIPIGGNHFTKALTQELKLTFSKAEHLKRNATKADDPKAVFQAMRPVFSDLLTEVRRSVGYFMNLNKEAKVKRVLALGNAMRLPGLQKYLIQNLGYDVISLSSFKKLSGSGVVGAPVFKDNMLSFPVAYGLAIQGLEQATLSTNLVPREIVRDRIIRTKKPWAVATAAAVLIACSLGFYGQWRPWNAARMEDFKTVVTDVDNVEIDFKKYTALYAERENSLKRVQSVEDKLKVHIDERYYFPELMTALAKVLPLHQDESEELVTEIDKRKQIHITAIECMYEPNLADWRKRMLDINPSAIVKAEDPNAAKVPGKQAANNPRNNPNQRGAPQRKPTNSAREKEVPKVNGQGWVVKLHGYHLYNSIANEDEDTFVENYLLSKLLDPNKGRRRGTSENNDDGLIKVLDAKGKRKNIRLYNLGFRGGTFTWKNTELYRTIVYNPNALNDPSYDKGGEKNPLRYEFKLEFVFQPQPLETRITEEIEEQPKTAKPPEVDPNEGTTINPTTETNTNPTKNTDTEPTDETNTNPTQKTETKPTDETNANPTQKTETKPTDETNANPVEDAKSEPAEEVNTNPTKNTSPEPAKTKE